MSGYTVLDFETTGLSPKWNDRVLELAIEWVSDLGEPQGGWSTLVNPGRDVGPTHIHHITGRDVASAPTFVDLAPDVIRAVEGRTIVSHNAPFEIGFLVSELSRAGFDIGDEAPAHLCTMQWSNGFVRPDAGRRLVDCCAELGVDVGEERSARRDAQAKAQLLATYLRECEWEVPWSEVLSESRSFLWPYVPQGVSTVALVQRGHVESRRPDEWLDRIVAKIPRSADVRVEAYRELLERAFLDQYLSEHEAHQLIVLAEGIGLSRGQVLDLHGDYLNALAAVALADGVVTDEELSDLHRVAATLGLPESQVDRVLSGETVADTRALHLAGINLEAGDRVVFTGDMVVDRSEWERRARAVGLMPGGIAKSTRVVVASDPDSSSGKAGKARQYGIPIITESAFERLVTRLEAKAGAVDLSRLEVEDP